MSFQSIDEKIDYFKKNILENHLLIATKIINGYEDNPPIPNSERIVFFSLMSYFETMGKYYVGNNGNEKLSVEDYFMLGFQEILVSPKDRENRILTHFAGFLMRFLYRGGRCTLYHVNQLDYRIVISNDIETAFKMEIPLKELGSSENSENFVLQVNVQKLLQAIILDFQNYLSELKMEANTVLLDNFESRFDKDMEGINVEKLSLSEIMGDILREIKKKEED